jgi:hypothetical protein
LALCCKGMERGYPQQHPLCTCFRLPAFRFESAVRLPPCVRFTLHGSHRASNHASNRRHIFRSIPPVTPTPWSLRKRSASLICSSGALRNRTATSRLSDRHKSTACERLHSEAHTMHITSVPVCPIPSAFRVAWVAVDIGAMEGPGLCGFSAVPSGTNRILPTGPQRIRCIS